MADESPKDAAESASAAPAKGAPELKCWNCAASLAELPRPITRHMNCPACFEDLHCCRMCRHFRESASSACDDERAEPPVYKEGANFCGYFRPAGDVYRQGRNERQAQAKAGLNALFADREATGERHAVPESQGAASAEDDARRRLDALFR